MYALFRGAVCRNTAVQPITVQLDDFEMIKLNSRGWYREYLTLTQYRSLIGYILKCIEIKMREHFGYKRNLQIPNISQVENSFLNSEPDKFTYPTRPTMGRLKVWKAKAFFVISSTKFESAIVRATLLNALKGGVVPRTGLSYITVGRKDEIDALLHDVETISIGGASFCFIGGK